MSEENKNETIIDDNIREWVNSFDVEINLKDLTNYINEGSDAVCQFLLKSAAAKIAIIDGIKKANEILRHTLSTEIEIGLTDIKKFLDLVSDFEMFTLAAKSMPIDKKLITELIKLKIEVLCQNNMEKSVANNDMINLLRKHLEDLHYKVGEIPDPNIHTVRMARNAEKREIRPFGAKQKK